MNYMRAVRTVIVTIVPRLRFSLSINKWSGPGSLASLTIQQFCTKGSKMENESVKLMQICKQMIQDALQKQDYDTIVSILSQIASLSMNYSQLPYLFSVIAQIEGSLKEDQLKEICLVLSVISSQINDIKDIALVVICLDLQLRMLKRIDEQFSIKYLQKLLICSQRLIELQQYDRAQKYSNQFEQITAKCDLPISNGMAIKNHINRAIIMTSQDRLQDALNNYLKAQTECSYLTDGNYKNSFLLVIYECIGNIYLKQSRHDQARQNYTRALQIWSMAGEEDHVNLYLLFNLAEIAAKDKLHSESTQYLTLIVNSVGQNPQLENQLQFYPEILFKLGRNLCQLSQVETAIPYLQRYIFQLEARNQRDSQNYVQCLETLAAAYEQDSPRKCIDILKVLSKLSKFRGEDERREYFLNKIKQMELIQ